MDSLLERIEENKLDALYLFINETLRDRQTFDIFVQNLVTVLPHNWSIQRVELGHEFLSMVAADDQDDFFELICGLESLRTLIISDGYVPRKDNGSVSAGALLSSLPKARNLINLDLQRLHIQTRAHVQMLESVFESLADSLEEIRITGLVMDDAAASKRTTRNKTSKDCDDDDESDFDQHSDSDKEGEPFGMLDGPVEKCIEMSNLRSLTISQKQQSSTAPYEDVKSLVSPQCLSDLCQNCTTLQDLCLRSMKMDDATCHTLANALKTNSFLTSLDLRQNDGITIAGYGAILRALEQNFDLWCSVLVVRSPWFVEIVNATIIVHANLLVQSFSYHALFLSFSIAHQ
jgi:hypothetical protein